MKTTYKDIEITIGNETRLISGLDIPLILRGQARPLRNADRTIVGKFGITDEVIIKNGEIILTIAKKEIYRMPKEAFTGDN